MKIPRNGAQVITKEGLIFTFDATTSEDHEMVVEVTDHEIDASANVTDHARISDVPLTVSGVITNYPVATGYDETRVQRTFRLMKDIIRKREVVTVVTGLESYENMICTSIKVQRKEGGSRSIEPVITFREVRFANLKLVAVPAEILDAQKRAAAASAQSKKDKGPQSEKNSEPTDVFVYEDKKSALKNLGSAFDKFKTGGFASFGGAAQ